MSTFEFRPSAPKPAKTVTFEELCQETGHGKHRLTAAKRVGSHTVKVFSNGPTNYYLKETKGLRAYLEGYGLSIG